MLSNKTTIALLMAALSTPVWATDTNNPSIEEMLQDVPDSQVEREKEIKKLTYIEQRLDLQKKIEQHRNEISIAKDETSGSTVIVETVSGLGPVEQQIQDALASSPTPSSSGSASKKSSSGFDHDVSLVSVFGNPSNPTAHIVIDTRPAEVVKGSILNGWKVIQVTAEYLQVSRKGKVSNVYFSNSSGE